MAGQPGGGLLELGKQNREARENCSPTCSSVLMLALTCRYLRKAFGSPVLVMKAVLMVYVSTLTVESKTSNYLKKNP